MERAARALPLLLATSRNMTVQLCRQLALAQKLRFYATSNASSCYAGNADPTYLASSALNCTAGCAGDAWLSCGGPGELFVHELPDLDREWMGCFDDPTLRYRSDSQTFADLTPDRCRDWALKAGYSRYGMQGADVCFGISRSPELPERNDSGVACTVECAGDRSQACGGPPGVASSIYRAVFDQQGAQQRDARCCLALLVWRVRVAGQRATGRTRLCCVARGLVGPRLRSGGALMQGRRRLLPRTQPSCTHCSRFESMLIRAAR